MSSTGSGARDTANSTRLKRYHLKSRNDQGFLRQERASSGEGLAGGGIQRTQHKEKREGQGGAWQDVASALTQATVPTWVEWTLITILIFGGCCGNVCALEAIIKDEPSAGPLITFVQFMTVAIFTLPSFVSWSAGPSACFLSPRSIPLKSWIVYTLFFVTVNLLNNWAFAYRISVPLHIILRSGGPVASMVIGYLYNSRRYSLGQVIAILLLTFGVVGAALADAAAQGRPVDISLHIDGDSKALLRFLTGFTLLALAMILSAFQGVYADRLYAKHGNTHWQEALLYSHLLSLPFFVPTYPQLSSQLRAFLSSPRMLSFISTELSEKPTHPVYTTASTSLQASNNLATTILNGTTTAILATASHYPAIQYLLARTPVMVAYLAANALTQYLCIRGVYLLAAKSSSLTVTIFLNVRKLASLLLSIYLFGNVLPSGVLVGAFLVFLGGALFGAESARLKKRKQPMSKRD